MSDHEIEILQFAKRYGEKTAVTDLDLMVEPGEIYALVGPNGAGKTTTIRAVLGLIRPTSGTVSVLGADPYDDRESRASVGTLLETSSVYGGLTALDNLVFFGRLHQIDDPRKRARELLARFGLGDCESQPASTFSKGMKRKLALARSLMADPRVLIFDEPTAGIDPNFQQDFRDLIAELSFEGRTVFLSSHNLQEVKQLCNRMTFMHEGRGVLSGTINTITDRFNNRKFLVWPKEPAAGRASPARVPVAGVGYLRPAQPGNPSVLLTHEAHTTEEVQALLARAKIEIDRIIPEQTDLIDIFELVGRV